MKLIYRAHTYTQNGFKDRLLRLVFSIQYFLIPFHFFQKNLYVLIDKQTIVKVGAVLATKNDAST